MAALPAALGEKQFLALVDRENQPGRLRLGAVIGAGGVVLSERLQHRPELCSAALTTARNSARVIGYAATANAASSAANRPVSPEIAACSGRIAGSGKKLRSSRSAAETGRRVGMRIFRPGRAENTRSRGGVSHATRAAGRAPQSSGRRGQRKCRRLRLRAGAARDRAAGPERPLAARRNTWDRARLPPIRV